MRTTVRTTVRKMSGRALDEVHHLDHVIFVLATRRQKYTPRWGRSVSFTEEQAMGGPG